jgi:hypothetical protein
MRSQLATPARRAAKAVFLSLETEGHEARR